MPASDSPAVLVAKFLKANRYDESFEAFIAEAGLSPETGVVSNGDLTLEKLLEAKKTFDLSQQYEKLGTDDEKIGWALPAPSAGNGVAGLPSSSNILGINVGEEGGSRRRPLVFVTTADRRLHMLDASTAGLVESWANLHDAPILSSALVRSRFLLTSSMSGHVLVSDLQGNLLPRRKDHSKYVIKVVAFEQGEALLVATAGWDCKINIYKPSITDNFLDLGDPSASVTLPSKPEDVLVLQHPENSKPILVVSRTDSSFLYFYTTESPPRLLGKQNLAPHSNAWVAFTPSALALHPRDRTLLAVGTSSVPHMKLLIVRLLVPPFDVPTVAQAQPAQRVRTSLLDDGPATVTQASQARAALAVAQREDAAIQIHCTTMAPQTAYSTPGVAWRPDGSGVWVNGDDGAVRGIEAESGKVVATLQGHEAGTKVRCLWAGEVEGETGREELLITGGFDQKLILWRTRSSGEDTR